MPQASDDRLLPDVLDDFAETAADADDEEVVAMLEAMVLHPDYPCLGARSVFNRERARVVVLDGLGTEAAAQPLHAALTEFASEVDLDEGFASLIAIFRDSTIHGTTAAAILTEKAFEELLWEQLRQVHQVDDAPWDPAVSADPASPHFAFSVGGTAFFVVGLHPGASRIARRAPLPTLVFNVHEQFEQLRAGEQFVRMRDTIRGRDEALQGTVNPMVQDHGAGSEARQYAGRQVPQSWEPPVGLGTADQSV